MREDLSIRCELIEKKDANEAYIVALDKRRLKFDYRRKNLKSQEKTYCTIFWTSFVSF